MKVFAPPPPQPSPARCACKGGSIAPSSACGGRLGWGLLPPPRAGEGWGGGSFTQHENLKGVKNVQKHENRRKIILAVGIFITSADRHRRAGFARHQDD